MNVIKLLPAKIGGMVVVAVLEGLLAPSLGKRLEGALAFSRLPDPAWKKLVRRLGDSGAAFSAKIRDLIRRLGADRWEDREDAEKALVLLGRRAISFLEEAKRTAPLLEIRWRAARALKKILLKSPKMEKEWKREIEVFRALAWALMAVPPKEPARVELAKATLETARFDPDRELRLLAIRALARMKDPQVLPDLERLLRKAPPLESLYAIEGLVDLGTPAALSLLEKAASGERRPILALAARGELLAEGRDPGTWKGPGFLAAPVPPASPLPPGKGGRPWKIGLVSGEILSAEFLSLVGSGVRIRWKGGCTFRISSALLSWAGPAGGTSRKESRGTENPGWILFRSGTWFPGRVLSLEGDRIRTETSFLGVRSFPKEWIQGWGEGRAPVCVGPPPGWDWVELKGDGAKVCHVFELRKNEIRVRYSDGGEETFPKEKISALLFAGGKGKERLFPGNAFQGLLVHGWKLKGRGEIKAFLVRADPRRVYLVDPFLGLLTLPMNQVASVDFRVGLGKGMGLTLVSDLDQSRVVEFNSAGKVVWTFKDLDGGPLDAKWLPDGNLLVCEEGGRVREVTREGKTVWEMDRLNLPYSAEKLPDGNYLIADTGHRRVIEVTPGKKIVWIYRGVAPYDVQRLPDGNTLIADGAKDRVIEVNEAGRIVWSIGGMTQVRDADRLPNGNTLVTCWGTHSVVEVDPQGNVVWKVTGLETPSDADRLPGGRTLIAESGRVRVVDWRGRTVWSVPVGWAVEANRY